MEVSVKIDGEMARIKPELVLHSRNPRTKRYCVNLRWKENGVDGWVQVFCRDEETEAPAKELAEGIREGSITDLTEYKAERLM